MNFPRLRTMFADAAARQDVSLVTQPARPSLAEGLGCARRRPVPGGSQQG
ncbi:hypothetical protein G5V59_12095 [Nocardioides sp. W3-2-3]|nr:hypothetical protein [Nocardioides convexus]NHA00516.1 hypothetical protein [Nocardioides convexus]